MTTLLPAPVMAARAQERYEEIYLHYWKDGGYSIKVYIETAIEHAVDNGAFSAKIEIPLFSFNFLPGAVSECDTAKRTKVSQYISERIHEWLSNLGYKYTLTNIGTDHLGRWRICITVDWSQDD